MKYSNLLVIAFSAAALLACAEGEEPATKPSGGGGQIVGGTGGMVNPGGTGNSGGGSVSADCQAAGYTDPTCGACMETNCATQCDACMQSSDCNAWLQCAVNCSDAACEDGCTQQYPGGSQTALAWIGNDGCIGAKCDTPCKVSGCGLSTNGTAPECDTCIESYCCTQGSICGNDQGCIDVLTCMQGCASGDTTCENNCASANPTGAQELDNFFGCLDQMCPGTC